MSYASDNIKFITDIDSSTVLHLGQLPDYDEPDYDLTSEKGRTSYFKALESFVRRTRMYKRLINYLKQEFNMNESSFSNISKKEGYHHVKIEIHHYPITLLEICYAVFDKRNYYQESLNIEDVAEEVMYVHYILCVGLISLTTTEHKLAHSGYLFIPTQKVFGKFFDFIEMYKPWLPEGLEDKVMDLHKMSQVYDEEMSKNPLRVNYIYTDTMEAYNIPKLEDVLDIIQGRIDELQLSNYQITKPTQEQFENIGVHREDVEESMQIPIMNQLEGDYSSVDISYDTVADDVSDWGKIVWLNDNITNEPEEIVKLVG